MISLTAAISPRKRNKRYSWILIGAGLSFVLALCFGCVSSKVHFYSGYDPAAPLNVSEIQTSDPGPYTRTTFYFDGEPGVRVPAILALPKSVSEPVPCVVFLHGIGQDRMFLDRIAQPFTDHGFAIVSFDQGMTGERSLPDDTGVLEAFSALRARMADTVTETRRLIDYLETRPDIDARRIYLIGASFGAITGAVAAAYDPRIQACVLVYGGGNNRELLRGNLIEESAGPWLFLAKPLILCLLRPADPVRHVGGISPRPILFQNGTRDEIIPRAAAEALHEAAREPKEIIWYDSEHVGEDEALTRRVLDDALNWLLRQDGALR